jgi:hypothetical protein
MAALADDVRFGPNPAEVSAGPQLDIIGVFDQIWCERPPCQTPRICVVVGFSANAAEFGQQRIVRVQLLSTENTVVQERQQVFYMPTPSVSESRSSFYPIVRFQDVLFPTFGPYVFRVSVGEEHKIDLPIHVSQSGGQV